MPQSHLTTVFYRTILRDRFVLRSCALHYALTEDDVVAIIEEVCQVGEQCLV